MPPLPAAFEHSRTRVYLGLSSQAALARQSTAFATVNLAHRATPLATSLDPHAHFFAGLNCNDQRNCFEARDKVEGALAKNGLEAIGGINADDE